MLWNKVAEAFAANIKKGGLVAVSGEFYIEEWEKTSNKHQKPCLKINQIQLTKKLNDQVTSQQQSNNRPAPQPQNEPPINFDD